MQLLDYQQRAVSALSNTTKGKIFIPTGGGKTLVMMTDAKNRIEKSNQLVTIVVVAPRILLANQLSDEFEKFLGDEKQIIISHVHSGETHNYSKTQSDKIATHHLLKHNISVIRRVRKTDN